MNLRSIGTICENYRQMDLNVAQRKPQGFPLEGWEVISNYIYPQYVQLKH
jgi:hypothetical protein